jgi:hypothetical protein
LSELGKVNLSELGEVNLGKVIWGKLINRQIRCGYLNKPSNHIRAYAMGRFCKSFLLFKKAFQKLFSIVTKGFSKALNQRLCTIKVVEGKAFSFAFNAINVS